MEQRVRFEGNLFVFSPPADWRDDTEYAFRHPGAREIVTVTFAPMPLVEARDDAAEAALLGAWIARQRKQIADGLGANVAFAPECAAAMGIWPALRCAVAFEDGKNGAVYRNLWAVALINNVTGVEIAYRCDLPEAEAEARFDQILRNVRAVGSVEWDAPLHFLRHQAQFITLALPEVFEPPLNYRFQDGEERAALTLQFAHSPRLEVLQGAEWHLLAGVETLRRIERDPSQNSREYVIHKAALPLEEKAAVILTGRSTLADNDRLETPYAAMARSIARIA